MGLKENMNSSGRFLSDYVNTNFGKMTFSDKERLEQYKRYRDVIVLTNSSHTVIPGDVLVLKLINVSDTYYQHAFRYPDDSLSYIDPYNQAKYDKDGKRGIKDRV